jgi:hypothetical protein
MITDISNVMVNISYFDSRSNYTNLKCVAVFQDRKSNSALDLLNDSMGDKTFARKMSNELGFQVTVGVKDKQKLDDASWIIISTNDGIPDRKRTPDLGQ